MIPLDYYRNSDVLFLSRDLLGKCLFTSINGVVTGGVILETEAYRGPEDRASHAHKLKRTKRNEVMYAAGGVAYVYWCYGIHSLFNIVTNQRDIPHAILIRAIQPIEGVEMMLKRRKKKTVDKTLAGGPGTLTQALGITVKHNGLPLTGPTIWIEDKGIKVPKAAVTTGPRVGVDYAGEDANLPWRFRFLI